MAGEFSSYSFLVIHIAEKVGSDARMEPPIQTEKRLSGGAETLHCTAVGACGAGRGKARGRTSAWASHHGAGKCRKGGGGERRESKRRVNGDRTEDGPRHGALTRAWISLDMRSMMRGNMVEPPERTMLP